MSTNLSRKAQKITKSYKLKSTNVSSFKGIQVNLQLSLNSIGILAIQKGNINIVLVNPD